MHLRARLPTLAGEFSSSTVKSIFKLIACSLFGQALLLHADSWSLTDGSHFDAEVKLVTQGLVIFTQGDGSERAVETRALTVTSRLQLVKLLGLDAKEVPAEPLPEVVVPKQVPLSHPGRDPKAMDATQVDLIDSQYGLTGKVVGVVKEVISLGKTGHKKLSFEDTDFNVFISKRFLESSSEWKLDGLAGKVVQITGEVAKYQEVVQIAVKEPAQIQVLP
jgi:DNA/RNA endonuclease YhcR with UshA esterase domain